ncbi:strawberry notch C-terminal domain-containing protein [Iodobacter sp. CM08]|uniref:strawberry notch C-terminal domain-containing protein n=1 Tax=Iodobacter sp. CM08 TaxID=3085902 RepID=UPI002981621A|nr:strawberry notch C-terminal domain-containing protein [Iodobacter sp. CM08]MDW5418751.1 strawberry notch C-terminal domain-containing protein [Iodobacter sp. CM08]
MSDLGAIQSLRIKQLVASFYSRPFKDESMAMDLLQPELEAQYLYASPTRPVWVGAVKTISNESPTANPRVLSVSNQLRVVATVTPLSENLLSTLELVLGSKSARNGHVDLVVDAISETAPLILSWNGGLDGLSIEAGLDEGFVVTKWKDKKTIGPDKDFDLDIQRTKNNRFKLRKILLETLNENTTLGTPKVDVDPTSSLLGYIAERFSNQLKASDQPAPVEPIALVGEPSAQPIVEPAPQPVNEQKTKWIDASALDIHLGFAKLPDHQTTVLALINNGLENIKPAIDKLGFKESTDPRFQGIYFMVPEGGIAKLQPIYAALRECVSQPQEVKGISLFTSEIVNRINTAISARTQLPDLDKLFAQATMLVSNHEGEMIWATPYGRMVTPSRESAAIAGTINITPIMEKKGEPSARFGYLDEGANGQRQLASMAAYLFADAVENLGRHDSLAKLANLKQVVNEGREVAFKEDEFEECIERGLVLAMERWSRSAPDAESIRVYAWALHGLQPSMGVMSPSKMALQQYSSPLHLSVAVQSIFGSREEITGKTFLDTTVGHGSLLSTFSGVAKCFGGELDPKRIARIDQSDVCAPIVYLADATNTDFSTLFEQDGFDYVVVNPPFADTERNHVIPLPKGSNEPAIVLRKLDHILALKALHERKPDGRAVLLLGADSAVNPTATGAGTRRVLQYIADHYKAVSMAVLDGSIYKKQGASWPITVVAIGARRPAPEIQPSITTLPLLRNMEDVERWADTARVAIEVEENPPAPAPAIDQELNATLNHEFVESGMDSILSQLSQQPSSAISPPVPDLLQESSASEEQKPAASASASADIGGELTQSIYTPYIAMSKVANATTMVPINMASAIREHLQKIDDKYQHIGGIDGFVAREMQWTDEQHADGRLSPEQVDALAMAIEAALNKKDFLIGDSVGTGKGRVFAAFMAWQKSRGIIPMFFTKSANLFTDMYSRDMVDIGKAHMFKRPLILNSGEYITTPSGKKIKSPSRSQLNEYISQGEIPEGTDIIYTTYSQFCRLPTSEHGGDRVNWFFNITANHNVVPVLDESHAAAGNSNTGENLSYAQANSRNNGHHTMLGSGTPIKGAANLKIYQGVIPLGGSNLSHNDILNAVKISPNDMQEALMSEITKSGLAAVRCHDTSTYERTYVPSEHSERNIEYADQFATVIRRMMFLSGEVAHLVGELNSDFTRDAELLHDQGVTDKPRFGASSTNFASRLYNINKTFIMALSADDIVEQTLLALRRNQKPVVALNLTGGALLADYLKAVNQKDLNDDDNDFDESETPTESYSSRREMIIEKPLDIKDMLLRYLDRIGTIKITSSYGNVVTQRPDSPEYQAAEQEIYNTIMLMPDLPMMPIDYLRHKIEQEGYSVQEITGRSHKANFLPSGKVAIVPRPEGTSKSARREIAKLFNNGQCDVLILNEAGSTGSSLHSSPSEGYDTRQRNMIKWELQGDVNTERQIDGRVGRRGELNPPTFTYVLLGLPAQDRLIMMFNNKNRSLSSSSTSNRQSETKIDYCPDLLNSIGGTAAKRLLEENIRLANYMSISLPDEKQSWPFEKYASILSGRMSMLPVKQQFKVYKEWVNEFEAEIEILESKGINPLKSKHLDIKAELVDQIVLFGDPANMNVESIFEKPVLLSTYKYTEIVEPIRFDTVAAAIRSSLANLAPGMNEEGYPVGLIEEMGELKESHLATMRPARFASNLDALSDKGESRIKTVNTAIEWAMDKFLPLARPGSLLSYTDFQDELKTALITKITPPKDSRHLCAISHWHIDLAIPGVRGILQTSLNSLHQMTNLRIMKPKGDPTLSAGLRSEFDLIEGGLRESSVHILEGNIFMALSQAHAENLGTKITFTRSDLSSSLHNHHGVLVKNAHAALEKVIGLKEPIRNAELLVTILNTPEFNPKAFSPQPAKYTTITNDRSADELLKNVVYIKPMPNAYSAPVNYTLSIPSIKKHGGELLTDPALTAIPGKTHRNKFDLSFNPAKYGPNLEALITHDKLQPVLEHLIHTHGMTFYIPQEKAKAAREILAERTEKLKANKAADSVELA